jgi:hypothetical protein
VISGVGMFLTGMSQEPERRDQLSQLLLHAKAPVPSHTLFLGSFVGTLLTAPEPSQLADQRDPSFLTIPAAEGESCVCDERCAKMGRKRSPDQNPIDTASTPHTLHFQGR